MGQKVHPYGFRLGVVKTWKSKWYEDKNYATWLHEDLKLKKRILKEFVNAGIADIEIERAATKAKVVIFTSRPGIIIGKRGAGVEKLKADLQKLTQNELFVDIQEVRKAETNAKLVAESIATQLERRVAFRRAMKKAVQTAMKFGVKGIRVNAAGRLGGAEIARREWYREGRVPLHTLRADIDYGFREAHTTYGRIGVKVWIYKGNILPYKPQTDDKAVREAALAVGDTAGEPKAPRRVVSSAAKKRADVAPADEVEESTPLVKEADPDLERLLEEEEQIERATRQHHETPHFRPGDGD